MSYTVFNNDSVEGFASSNPGWAAEASHPFRPADRLTDRRAPCPGLNALANHGYIPHSGTHITFLTLLNALRGVYNLSLPLALFLTIPAFLIYGKFRLTGWPWHWSYTLDLASLSSFGPYKIAHRASLVHPNEPSHAPDPTLLFDFLSYAQTHQVSSQTPLPSSTESEKPCVDGGLTLLDFAHLRISREAELARPLSSLHEQIALGESSLTWLLFRDRTVDGEGAMVPQSFLRQWFGEERLPEGWICPTESIGLLQTKKVAGQLQKNIQVLRSSHV